MELFAGASVALLVLAALAVALKTLALWRRTKGRPELLLGAMLLSATVVGYPAVIASTQLTGVAMGVLQVVSQLAFSVGYGCLLLFTVEVFRPRVFWAKALAGATLLGFAVAMGETCLESLTGHARPTTEVGPRAFLTSLPIAVAYFWTAFEAISYHRRMQLQLRVGLGDRVVANRVLLWGLMGLAAGAAVLLNAGAAVAGVFMSPATIFASSLLGLVHATCLFVAFHPPRWYRAWLERRAASAAA